MLKVTTYNSVSFGSCPNISVNIPLSLLWLRLLHKHKIKTKITLFMKSPSQGRLSWIQVFAFSLFWINRSKSLTRGRGTKNTTHLQVFKVFHLRNWVWHSTTEFIPWKISALQTHYVHIFGPIWFWWFIIPLYNKSTLNNLDKESFSKIVWINSLTSFIINKKVCLEYVTFQYHSVLIFAS